MASSIMSDMDWDEGIAMPVANAENKRLEDELLHMQKEIGKYSSEVGDHDERIHSMSQHLKNVRQELTHNLALLNAHTKEIETEEHLSAIAEREDGRLHQEITRLQKELDSTREKRNNFENKIFMQSQQLEELKSHMNWDQQALEAWLEESARRDEDALTLQKYASHDHSKLKELALLIEHLTEQVQKKRKCLDQETTETLTAQIELDKTAEEFRKAHTDRHSLITQWEITIEQMQRRDREMDHAALELAKVKEEVRQREQVIKEKQAFLESEMENNQEMDKKIAFQERLAAKLRIDLQEHENTRTQLQDELDTLKYTVERTASDLEAMKTNVASLRKEIVNKQDKLEQATLTREALQDKLEAAGKGALTAEERAEAAAFELSVEEDNVTNLEKDLMKTREIQFRKKQELYEVITKEKNIAAEIQGSRAANRNLSSRLKKLDQQSIKQQEIVYNQDFTIQQLERRLARLQGDMNTDEKKELEAKIEELTQTLDERNAIHTLLTTQLKRLQDDIRRQKRDMERTGEEKADLTSKIEELNLHNEISVKELKNTIDKKQESMVEDNILKLEIKRIQDALHRRADEVLSLEKRQLQLSTAMKERKQEISVHKDMLFSQLKAAQEERQTVNAELHQRTEKIEKLRKRYEILMVSMAPPEGEEEKSQAYYVIKAAQDKEELQRTGDELDARIRKAEKEIRALENTLRLMNSRNETYRKSFNKVTETSEEYEKKNQLDEKLRSVMDKYKYKRRQIRELQEDLQTMSSAMDSSLRDETTFLEMVQDRKMKIQQLQKDTEEQKQKLERVQKQIARTSREARVARKSRGPMLEERDMDLREVRSRNRTIAKNIAQLVNQFPDLTNAVEAYFQQVGLPVPTQVPESRSSSKTSSVRSSARSSPRSSVSSARYS
uniref:Coiled-coil domain-containing protein 39 n=1 Tax=Phallusia mammillata TaxID=59560 RepID=A0A6F9D8S5_9ASCI|nr:coiled-coil domain-containing protein 39-like [Phallusia mammillata]